MVEHKANKVYSSGGGGGSGGWTWFGDVESG